MIKIGYLKNRTIPITHIKGRNFMVLDDIHITLSNGYVLKIPKGFTTDFMSVPYWLWSFITPIDDGLLGDVIHDRLWSNEEKVKQIEYHGSIIKAKNFSDKERHRWRQSFVPDKKLKNKITTLFLSKFSMKYYTGQTKMRHWKQ